MRALLAMVFCAAGFFGTAPRAAAGARPCELRVEEVGVKGYRELVDVTRGLVVREGVRPRPVRARVGFTMAERETLCEILALGNVFDLPWSYGNGSPNVRPTMSSFHFILRIGSRRKEFWWRPDVDPSKRQGKVGPDHGQDFLFDFRFRLGAMLRRKPAYQALPRGLPTY